MRSLVIICLLAGVAAAEVDDDAYEALGIKDPGEVIVIEGHVPPATPPKPTNYVKTAAPPYSDRAILSDAWTKAWMLLEIDERGAVTRVKFLNKPGYDLEPIAIAQAFKLKFAPALDGAKQAMRSTLVWEIEWPSAYWLGTFVGVRSTMPPVVGFPPRRMDDYVPCRGSGPLNLGSVRPTYKDCTKPDLSKIPTAPWIDRKP
jgi:hypothetical protein